MHMKIEEYKIKEDAWIKEQYQNETIKPVGMFGHWAYHVKKQQEFSKIMKNYGLERDL